MFEEKKINANQRTLKIPCANECQYTFIYKLKKKQKKNLESFFVVYFLARSV